MQVTSPPAEEANEFGALAVALARVGDRWSLQVVDALSDGPRRFAELTAMLPGIATNVLSTRLRHLEAERVLMAVPYTRRPLRYSYELTAAGQALAGPARLLAHWGAEHAGAGGAGAEGNEVAAPAHEACGTPMVARWWCPTCEQTADADGAEVRWI